MQYKALKNDNSYYLLKDDNELRWFINRTGLYNIGHSFGDTYITEPIYGNGYIKENVSFVILDINDSIVQKEFLIKIYNNSDINYSKVSFYKKRRYPKQNYKFRCDPVPDIHISHWASSYRHPKTRNEILQSFSCNKRYIRAARNIHNLPNSWDDVQRSDRQIKYSWKKRKVKKQWMTPKTMARLNDRN